MTTAGRILFVDDEEDIRRGMKQLLELEGYDVICASDGLEALRMFEAELRETGICTLDLLITDIKMPRMDGLRLLQEVQLREPQLPVIIITGHGALQTAVEAMRHGAYDFITKPFEQELVLASVSRAIANHRLQLELTAMHKLAGLGTLAGGVAHELNTPLGAILAAAERVLKQLPVLAGEEGAASAQERAELLQSASEYLDMIVRNSLRCGQIVRALKTYARVDRMEQVGYELNAVVRESLILLEHTFKVESNIAVTANLAEGLPHLWGDPNKLLQVFLNLLTNARDAMAAGGRITITTRRGPDGESVQAIVEDEGPGIRPEVLPSIWDPFFTTKPLGQGTGLGLSIVIGIVHDHGGSIEVESAVEQGTRFVITLPVSQDRVWSASFAN